MKPVMKNFWKSFIPLLIPVLLLVVPATSRAQSQELQQLILDVEKLTQFKNILNDMKTGYQIYSQGYGTISRLSKGNFSLHDLYLGSLLAINPAVKNYGRVAEILSMQTGLVGEYRAALSGFHKAGTFSSAELSYIENVYSRLLTGSLDDLNELTVLITAKQLRMSDAERIEAIDRLYAAGADKLQFIRSFNRQGTLLAVQRSKAQADNRTVKQLYGLTKD